MRSNRNARYPYHLAKLVAGRLQKLDFDPPPPQILLRFFETLYFASLHTDEGRHCLCNVSFVERCGEQEPVANPPPNHWKIFRFEQALAFDVPTLTKLSEAADPNVSSLAVCCDSTGKLVIWGMVDQERRYSDFVALDSDVRLCRPGLFQAAIAGVGNISVSKDYDLLGSLEQDALIDAYHNVLWTGPVHALLSDSFHCAFANVNPSDRRIADATPFAEEMFIRWENAICRMLLNIQQYRHGGGLLLVPRWPADDMHVKHELTYDRLPQALLGMVRHQILRRRTGESIAQHCSQDAHTMPCDLHTDAIENRQLRDEYKNEVLGCVRFIASLSRIDGFVAMDRGLVARGFGVEARADSELSEIFIAGDALGTPKLLKPAALSQFGTRHRAMMRYCDKHDGALGFVVSQDGDIRATMKVDGRLILWENINLHLQVQSEQAGAVTTVSFPDSRTRNVDFERVRNAG